MARQTILRQSGAFETFQCIGAACEDTCCKDWGVSIDRKTYEKYQACDDADLQPSLHQLVTINAAKTNDEDFARISLTNNCCPFLAEGLCSIQLKLGESYLSNTCATYPRAINLIDGIVERSLHLSCPEAARLVLLNQDSNDWKEKLAEAGDPTRQGAAVMDSQHANRSGTPYPFFNEVRELFLDVLRARTYPRWQRLAILAQMTEELNAILNRDEQADETGAFVRRSLEALQAGAFDVRRVEGSHPLIQIETVLELIVARIGSDFTARRFLECYREFMNGVGWGPESTLEEINARYARARILIYEPFMRRHEYLLDNFLINYAIRMVLPYGHREADQRVRIEFIEDEVRRQYLTLAIHYAAVRTVLIGMAAFHESAFGLDHVVKLVQSYSKAFQHSGSYAENALKILETNGISKATEAVVLFQ